MQGLRAGHLVIIDEAALAGTATVDRVSDIAEATGAAVGSSAIRISFTHRSRERISRSWPDAPELADISPGQRVGEAPLLALGRGEVEVIATTSASANPRRIDEMLDLAYRGWLGTPAQARPASS